MRWLTALGCALALNLMGCNNGGGGPGGAGGDGGAGGGLDEFVPGAPVTVSGSTPFEGCEPISDEPFNPGAEVEAWIVVNPTDPSNMVGAWIQDPGHTSGLVTGVTFDGGETWEEVVIPDSRCTGGDITLFSGDPWLTFAPNGDLYSVGLMLEDFSFEVSEVHVNKSVDGGRTWGTPTSLVQGSGHDKPSISADPLDPCVIYVGWVRLAGESEILLSRTADCGATWSEPQSLFSNTTAASGFQLLGLPDGTALAFFRQTQTGSLYLARSRDQGETWSEAMLIAETGLAPRAVEPDGNESIRGSGGLFDVAVDRSSGYLAAVWQQLFQGMPLTSPIQIAFSSSSDGGQTWTGSVRIDHTPPAADFRLEQAFIPSVEISDDGTIGVTYYNFQNDTPDDDRSDTDYWFIHCHPDASDCNAAAGWSDGIRLTPEPFDYQAAPYFMDGLFLGDYAGLASSGSDFYALFAATTNDDPGNSIFVPIRAE